MTDSEGNRPQQPPAALYAEQLVLGTLLLDGQDLYGATVLLQADTFADPIHGAIFRAIQRRITESRLVDVSTISDDLRIELQQVGGAGYLRQLVGIKYGAFIASLQSIEATHLQRQIIEAGRHLRSLAEDATSASLDPSNPTGSIDQVAYLATRLRCVLALLGRE